ncbi:hypothetical protein FRC08_003738 [Ceratobasidium sp. 394]|nr:hypothetical protein FRC08_003738 [Ceratobasidium sp. 394]KAG9098962.1 hypothetical protein FS749_002480 [Ceratobasidium sp. UAMH 11750]
MLAAAQYNGIPFSKLTPEQKTSVRTAATATVTWFIHILPEPHIRHRNCAGEAETASKGVDLKGPLDICMACLGRLRHHGFQNALNKPATNPKNLKYVTWVNRNNLLGLRYANYHGLQDVFNGSDNSTGHSPSTRFAIKVAQGHFDNAKVLSGLIEAAVAENDRIQSEKSLKGHQMPPVYKNFLLTSSIMSPHTYRLIKTHLPAMGEQTVQKTHSKSMRFPLEICDTSFTLAHKFLSKIKYSGPVALSCDDTQLLPRLLPYHDAQKDEWHLIGGIEGPICLQNSADVLEKILKENKVEKATKVAYLVIPVIQTSLMPV